MDGCGIMHAFLVAGPTMRSALGSPCFSSSLLFSSASRRTADCTVKLETDADVSADPLGQKDA